MEKLHAYVTGQVQGVGFRYFVKRNADALSLTGFVRNLPEGQVEVMAEGSHASLEQLLTSWIWGLPVQLLSMSDRNMGQQPVSIPDFHIETSI